MTPLKIKITVKDKSLEMQVLEQDKRLRGVDDIYHNGNMYISSCSSPDLYPNTIFVRGSYLDEKKCIMIFKTNSDRDSYLARVKRLIHDFRIAWKAGEVEVLR
jgi:hypothetical protein